MTKPERAITCLFIGIPLLIAVGIVWSNRDIDSNGPAAQAFREARPPKSGWFSSSAAHRVSKRSRQEEIDRIYQLIVARHPELAIPWKNVPDDKNGFLRWLEFSERHRNELALPDDIKNMFDPSAKWDGARVGQWLAENKSLMDEITTIGLLPDQSAHHVEMPPAGIINPGFFKQCADLLCLQSRWQATQQNPEAAARTLQATMGLANHLDQIEIPCMMNTSVSTLIRLTAQHLFFGSTLPTLTPDTDLTPWQQNLQWGQLSPSEYARFLRGEWHISLRHMVLPEILNNDPEMPNDPERFVDAWAKHTKQQIDACTATGDWLQLQDSFVSIKPNIAGLSPVAQQWLKNVNTGSNTYIKGFTRVASTQTLQAAAFAHLRGEAPPNEPITGLPYVWDASTKTLSAPNDPRLDELKLKPIKLPR